MRSIKNKILFVVISGLLVITAVVSAIAVNMTHGIMHKDADRILNNVAQKEAATINDALGDVIKSANVMEHYAVSEVDDIDQLQDAAALKQYLDKAKKMFTEIALNTNGAEGYYLRLNPQYTNSKAGFYCLLDDHGAVQEMPITDLSQYSESDEKNVGWYYTAVNKGEAVWLEPYYFPGHSVQLISYTIPMYSGSKLLGVVGFDMDFEYLLERIHSISVYDHGTAALQSADGKTEYTKAVMLETKNPHTAATAKLLNGMKLTLAADYKDIQKDIHPMLRKIVFAFIVVLAVSILYTILVTHRIVRPLKQLTRAAEQLSLGTLGNETPAFPINSKDEVGTLSKVLSNTYVKIQEYTTYINALAYRDSLTGIKNSTAYTEATVELNREINCGNPRFGVLVADINNLKLTNDRYGHDIGNELIVHTAKILVDIFKTSSVFRIGGDEFVVILRDSDYADYRTLLARLDEACAQEYILVNEERLPVSLARGVSLFDPEIDRVYQDVFAKADHAMYLDKQERKESLV